MAQIFVSRVDQFFIDNYIKRGVYGVLRINMSKNEVIQEKLSDRYFLLGGRGLTSRFLMDEVDPACEPFGSNNKIVIAPGLLGGTVAPCSGRISIGAKSPLTGGIKESNEGGTAAGKLAKVGIRALVYRRHRNAIPW